MLSISPDFLNNPLSTSITKGGVESSKYLYNSIPISSSTIHMEKDTGAYIVLKQDENTSRETSSMSYGDGIVNINAIDAISATAIVNGANNTDFQYTKSLERQPNSSSLEKKSLIIEETLAKFYIGSITIVGLYVFYRILVKYH
jgi:hypothetical protein